MFFTADGTEMDRTINTKEACFQYAFSRPREVCEVSHLLVNDREIAGWLSRHKMRDVLSVHHIHKRPKPIERNYWCNLIRISKAAHDWIHDVNPYAGELVCWKAKLQEECRRREWIEVTKEPGLSEVELPYFSFHLPTLNKVVTPFKDFRGRVEFLHQQCTQYVFATYADDLLKWIDGERS